jgi:hypothetical protein
LFQMLCNKDYSLSLSLSLSGSVSVMWSMHVI